MRNDGPEPVILRDVEGVVQAFANAGIELRVDRITDRSNFAVEFKAYPMGAAQLIRTQWATDAWVRAKWTDHMAVVMNPSRLTPSVFTISGVRVAASTSTAPIVQPGQAIKVFRPAKAPLLVLSADTDQLARHFREITLTDPGPLGFELSLNLASLEGKRVQQLVRFVLHELSTNPSALDNPIVRSLLDDMVLGGMLALPGQHLRCIDGPNCSSGSAVVRRAEEFMEANFGNPIGMLEVAAACGCSRTKLFLAFKRERPWTPLQFLVRRRMEAARRALLHPTPNLTVTTVALDCGYATASRFAQEYRKLYGEVPSVTLKRSR
ncbi:MAG: AraC family transcriptional regulator [Gammaproteobacteria bacterium]|nr:AraC family transcriptional regulator [Gammaproteobacteria bacterium]MDJ0870990.1 AraC family transcriptional regulator [Gammaproteobacteria bacterium]MDJ0889965.1 AraC family transcriptional regulator [Gammaproteobacteria bacterium]